MGKAKKGDGNEVPESSGILASLDAWDKRVSYAFYLGNSSLAPVAIPICKALEVSGNGFFWLGFGMLGLRYDQPNAYMWVNLYAGLFIDLAVAGLVKAIFRRDRPVYSTNKNFTFSVDRFSFPSGHTMRMTYIACLCTKMIPLAVLPGVDKSLLWAGMVGWAATVCVSRVVYGRHHLLDVVAGVGVGIMTYNLHVTSLWVPPETAVLWQAVVATPILPLLKARAGI
eukprot:m.225174 g.225174  ORF g.225174 m.225174 type:complete len:226 (-) comp34870_c0_seq1:84-761(-)